MVSAVSDAARLALVNVEATTTVIQSLVVRREKKTDLEREREREMKAQDRIPKRGGELSFKNISMRNASI